jgi:hypothetical protein
LYFSDARLKAQLQAALKDALGRECEIGAFSLGLFSGQARLQDLVMKPDPAWRPSTPPTPPYTEGGRGTAEQATPTLKVARAEAQVALWPLLTSGGKNIQSAKVELQGLELYVELRREQDRVVTSADDIITKLTAGPPGVWPKNTGLKALDFDLKVRDATLRLRDAELGESRIERLELTARQPALTAPVKVEAGFALATPTGAQEGRARLEGHGQWIDAQGQIGPETARELSLSGTLERVDLGFLARYAGAQGPVADGKYEWTLGRSFTGTIKAAAADLKSMSATVKLDSDGPVAIWQSRGGERPGWKAGEVPGRIEVDLSGGFTGGAWQTGPVKADLRLHPAGLNPALSLHLDSRGAAAPEQPFTLEFQARLDDLFATDLGALLGLKDQLGGTVKGSASLKSEPGPTWKAEGRVLTEGLVVVVGGVRQPSALDLTFHAQVKPDAAGKPESAELTLAAKGQAFEFGSREPVRLRSLNDLPKLSADAKLRIQVKGKELWQEFGPLLRVFNLGTPIEEELEGDLRVAGDAGKVTVQLNLQLRNQTGPPQPVRLEGEAGCDFAARGKAGGEPFASFDVKVLSDAGQSLALRVKGAAVRLPGEEIWEISDYSGAGELQFLSGLNVRLGKYVRFFLGPEYKVAGAFRQTARSKLTREILPNGEVGAQKLELTTDVKLAGLDLRGPALFPNKAPLEWQEQDADLHLELAQRFGAAKDALTIPKVTLRAGTLRVEGTLAEADLGLLKAAAAEAKPGERKPRFQQWLAALPDTAIEATVSAEALARLQGLGMFAQLGLRAEEPLAIGTLRLKAGYSAKTRQLRLGALDLRTPSWALNALAPSVDAAALAQPLDAGATKLGEWLPALPSFALTASLKPGAVARLQELKVLPPGAVLRGEAELEASYDGAGRILKLERLTFSSAGVALKLHVPALEAAALAAFLDAPQRDLASAAQLLADFNLELTARDALFAALRARELLPADPPVAGELTLQARYKKGADRLFIERLDFARGGDMIAVDRVPGTPLPLADLVLVAPKSPPVEVAAAGELLKKLGQPLDVEDAATHFARHFDRGLAVRRIAWTPLRVFELLKRRGVKGAWLDDALAGVYRFPPAWVVENLAAQAVGPPGQLEITGRFSTEAEWHPRPEAGQPRAENASASLSGAWRLAPLRVSVREGRYAAQGTLSFDEARILGRAAGPFGYTKAAGTPCSLRFDVRERPDGGVHVTQAALTGGPAEVTLTNADYAAGGIVIVEQVAARQGPLVGTLSGLTRNPGTDRFRFDFEGAAVELAQVLPWLDLPATLTGSGTLQDLKASYDGRLSAFPAQLTAQDSFRFRSNFKDVKITGRGALKDVASLSLNGELIASPFVVASKVLRTQLEYATPGKPAVAERLDLALQSVSAREKNTALFAALAQDGLPLAVQAQMRFATPFDLLATLDAISTLSAAAGPTKPAPSSADLSGIRKLRLDLSAEAPELAIGSVKVQNLRAPSVVFDALVLDVPSAAGVISLPSCENGNIEVREASYNVAGLPRLPIRHAQKFILSRVKFARPLNLVDTAELQLSGALEAAGSLAGAGFEGADRRSWKGDLRIPLRDLVAQTKTIKAKKENILGTLKRVAFAFASFFGDQSGFLPERMEFEPAELSVHIENGFAVLPQTLLTGKGPTAGLDLGLKGRVDLVKDTFDPAFVVWIAALSSKQQRSLGLDQLAEADRETILGEFEAGNYQLTLKGPVSAPSSNATELLGRITALKSRVDRMLQARTAPPAPGTANPPPPARK